MASEKASHPWSRAQQEDQSPHSSVNSSLSRAESPEEEPPAYVGIHESSSSQQPAPATELHKPVAIPAIDTSFDSPFLRAYAPVLKDFHLPHEVFLSFLERLNKAISNSPPLQVLDVTGGLLSSVPILFPLHWIGSAVSGLANLGNHGVSKSRTDSMLRDANRDIFGPRGLKIEFAKLDALAHIAKIPILDSQGKVGRQTELFQQLAIQDAAGYESGLDAWQRRLRVLEPWIAELEFDEDMPWAEKSGLARFNAKLKKYNGRDPRSRRGQQDSKQAAAYGSVVEEDDLFRTCLWLVIRNVDEQ